MSKEEVTTRAKFSAWMVTMSNGRAKVEYTNKPMTPSQALDYFKGASGVMGVNGDLPIR